LRNHGFLYGKGGWRLAPAYDLNPTPMDIKPRVLSLAINEADATGALDLAFEVAQHFGIWRAATTWATAISRREIVSSVGKKPTVVSTISSIKACQAVRTSSFGS
jgi:serine/threonine-protein kinase HipA